MKPLYLLEREKKSDQKGVVFYVSAILIAIARNGQSSG
jgi:hypothetical protein